MNRTGANLDLAPKKQRKKPSPVLEWRKKLSLVSAVFISLVFGCKSSSVYDTLPIDEKIAAAQTLMRQKEFSEAEDLLEDTNAPSLTSEQSSDIEFFLAKNDFLRGRYKRAYQRLRRFAKNNPFSSRLPETEETIYKIAMLYWNDKVPTFLGLGSGQSKAVTILETLRETFPRGTRAPDVVRLLADYYFERRYYEDAVFEYQALAREHPNSQWGPLADYRVGLSYFLQSRGARYDLDVLFKARYAFDQYLETYPEGTNRAEAEAALEIIAEMLEDRAFLIGEFYEKRNRPRGAVLSYQKALAQYPASNRAESTRDSIRILEPLVLELEAKERARVNPNDPNGNQP